MLQLKNETPFAAAINLFPDPEGIDTLYVTLKATFAIEDGQPAVAEEQVPVQLADEYWGEPGESSLKYASEAHLCKLSTDVVLVGFAQAPEARRVNQLDVLLRVGPVRKQVRVFGDREWTGRLLGRSITAPEPFAKLPLVWERAFGGVHEADPQKGKIFAEGCNPVGRAFRGTRSRGEMAGTLLPNLEDPAALLSSPGDKQDPACFAFVAPSWQPRVSFVGTYDQAWEQRRAPYLPLDFDSRFFNCAPAGLVCPGYLVGAEPVELTGVSPVGPLLFHLPVCKARLAIRLAGCSESPPLRLETVLFEPEESRFAMLWRAALPCDKQALKVESIDLALERLDLGGGAS